MPTIGTDALVCPPKHSQEKPPQAPPKEGMLPNGMPYKGKWADRRWRLSLLCGIPLDRKNHSNRLPLGAPPLGGGREGFQTMASVPTLWGYFCLKRAFLRCEETPFSSQGNALVALRKRLLQYEEGVPLILRSCYQCFCRVLA